MVDRRMYAQNHFFTYHLKSAWQSPKRRRSIMGTAQIRVKVHAKECRFRSLVWTSFRTPGVKPYKCSESCMGIANRRTAQIQGSFPGTFAAIHSQDAGHPTRMSDLKASLTLSTRWRFRFEKPFIPRSHILSVKMHRKMGTRN